MDRLPPKYVNVPVELVYSDLSNQVITTGVRIWGLGWRHNYEYTDPIRLETLCEITGLSRSQLYGHLGALSGAGMLRYSSAGGEFCFRFDWDLADGLDDHAGKARAGPSPENRTKRAVSVVVGSSSSSIREKFVLHDQQRQQQHNHAVVVGGVCEGGAEESRDLDGVSGILDEIGVREPTRSELAQLPEAYVASWARWFDGQDEMGVGWVISQMRVGADPPVEPERDDRQRYLEWASGGR